MSSSMLATKPPIAAVLAAGMAARPFKVSPTLWGFGGAHGGLTLALLTGAMQRQAEGRVLRRVFAQFRRPIRDELEIQIVEDGVGKTVSWLSANGLSNSSVAVTAKAIFSRPAGLMFAPVSPTMPSAPPPEDCAVFKVPTSFVPFADRTEIRVVGSTLPFSGASEPELVAWVRLVDDDLPPDDARLMILVDVLAPAYGALLDAPVPVPTITLTVSPGEALARAFSPWVLLRARADVASRDGWHSERIDAWSPDGGYLGCGEQLRCVTSL